MANQALQNGSDSDIASVYKQLTSSLQDLSKIDPVCAPHEVAELPKFSADSKITNLNCIGTIPALKRSAKSEKGSIGTISAPLESSGTWELEKTIANKGVAGISSTPTGDIVVTSWSGDDPIKVYSPSGNLKMSLDSKSSRTWNVVVSSGGKFYETCGGDRKYIRVFGSDGRYLSQFTAVSPSGVKSDAENTDLRGLAINHKDQVLVGEITTKYISIHELNGTHVTSFQVSVAPYFIATTSQDKIIVSPSAAKSVQILDYTGTLQHTINAPEGMSHWLPTGVCCGKNDNICTSNAGSPKGVYCFTSTGVYVGPITKDVKWPYGVVLLKNDQKVAVADIYECVKFFQRK